MPTNRSGFGDRGKETEKYDSDLDPGSSADRRSISLVAVRDDSESDNTGKADTESTKKEGSQSLVSSSQESEISSTEKNFRVGDVVKVHLRQTRNSLITSRG